MMQKREKDVSAGELQAPIYHVPVGCYIVEMTAIQVHFQMSAWNHEHSVPCVASSGCDI